MKNLLLDWTAIPLASVQKTDLIESARKENACNPNQQDLRASAAVCIR